MKQGASYKGYTLVEILIVVTILGIVAAAAIPNFSSTDPQKLEVAAEEIVEALRYARSEAIRTGEIHGTTIDINTSEVQVVKITIAPGPTVSRAILTHPVDKKNYLFTVGNVPFTDGVTITNAQSPFLFVGLGARSPAVMFDAQGIPMLTTGITRFRYNSGVVSLSYGNQSADVVLSPLGRVSIQ